MNKKSAAREFCFQYFFHIQLPIFQELRQEYDQQSLLSSLDDFKASTNTLLEQEMNSFVLTQLKNTIQNYHEIEERIAKYLINWKLNRVSKVDSTLLFLAFSELLYHKSTPPKVVINEYIEIAKKFGTKDSAPFINATLDNFVKSEIL